MVGNPQGEKITQAGTGKTLDKEKQSRIVTSLYYSVLLLVGLGLGVGIVCQTEYGYLAYPPGITMDDKVDCRDKILMPSGVLCWLQETYLWHQSHVVQILVEQVIGLTKVNGL